MIAGDWWRRTVAAVGEGHCPFDHGRLQPTPEDLATRLPPEVNAHGFCLDCNAVHATSPNEGWPDSYHRIGR